MPMTFRRMSFAVLSSFIRAAYPTGGGVGVTEGTVGTTAVSLYRLCRPSLHADLRLCLLLAAGNQDRRRVAGRERVVKGVVENGVQLTLRLADAVRGGARRRGGVRGRERLIDGLIEAGITTALCETGVALLAVTRLVGELVRVSERLIEGPRTLLELLEALHLG